MPDKSFIGLRIDIETKSSVDIKDGVYRYAESPDFDVLCVSYAPIRAFGDVRKLGAPRALDLADTAKVRGFRQVLLDPDLEKHAFNANFERIALSRWLGMPDGKYLDPRNWHCSAIQANVNGVYGRLSDVARAVKAPISKDPEGPRLIKLFSIPDKKTGLFHQPDGICWCSISHVKDFAKFSDYCTQDVLTEATATSVFPPISPATQAEYEMDQRINDRGFLHREKISRRAVEQVAHEKNRLMGELKALTGLDNPNSIQQMKSWLDKQGYPMPSLDKDHREEALVDPLAPEVVLEALELKGAASLSSVTKHTAALNTRCNDGRIRGSLQFHGAHTGREAGRGIQPQNLPRYEAPEADIKRLLKGKAGSDAPTIAKGAVRASIIPAKGNVFVVVDYNAIEARVLGWLAGERWVQEEFAKGQGKIYEATASMMFGGDKASLITGLDLCGKCGKENCAWCVYRNQGKVSNLALGYAGGAGALVTMGAEAAGLDIGNYKVLNAQWKAQGTPGKFHEWNSDQHDYPALKRLRDLYRDASPATVRFWKQCGIAWDRAAIDRKAATFGDDVNLWMVRDGAHNVMVLPSGRKIWYRFAKSHVDAKNPDRIDYRTFVGKSSGVGHARTETHGGKLTENVTQAVARDVLFDLMTQIEGQGRKKKLGKLVLHVHDEVVLEVPEKHADQRLEDIKGLMSNPPKWAPGLAVKGAGSVMEKYGK